MDTSTSVPGRPKCRFAVILTALFACAAVGFAVFQIASLPEMTDHRDVAGQVSPGEPGRKEEIVDGVRQSMVTFKSNGKDVRIERYFPTEPGRYPAILFLHGGGPASLMSQVSVRLRCREFVRRGYVALLPRFLDQTDTENADPPEIDAHFVEWMAAVSNALEYARRLPEVDPDHVGLIGWSLGSALALEVAATNPHSAAVVGNYGGMAKEIVDNLTRMPPTLLLDGQDDRNYPVRLARALYRDLKKKHVVVESVIYPGQGHGFGGDAAADCVKRTDAFFDKHLAGRQTIPPER
jgi:carboxymethylenebutenolidase